MTQEVSLGLSGNVVIARGSQTLESGGRRMIRRRSPSRGPTVHRRFMAISPEISLNFRAPERVGFISGGMFGRSKRSNRPRRSAGVSPPYRKTLNFWQEAR